MKLIKKLLPKYVNGHCQSFGLFLCPYCLKEVEKSLGAGKRDKSCGCVRYKLVSESHKGMKHTEEHNRKVSEAIKQLYIEGKELPSTVFKKGEDNLMYGIPRTEETKQKISKANKGKKRTEETKQKISRVRKGKRHTEETKQKISIVTSGKNNPMYGISRFGELNPNWQGGKSFEIYPQEFNKELKLFILERDSHKCQDPNCIIENPEKLHIHHIDFNKNNNNLNNLITLCNSCHSKTIGKNKKGYFIGYYKNIINNTIEYFS